MSIEILTKQILDKMPEIGKWQRVFFQRLMMTLALYRGRHNFENLGRYANLSSTALRGWYGKRFDFLTFNKKLIDRIPEEKRFVVFDPSYLPKSGKKTPGAGYFWSGCAKSTKYGLEIGGFASVGQKTKTALHLLAEQTVGVDNFDKLTDYYCHVFKTVLPELSDVSKVIALDGFFAKRPYVDCITGLGFTMVGKLASNSRLVYPFMGPHPKRRGPKRKYDGDVDRLDLREDHFRLVKAENDEKIFEGEVYVYAFRRICKCVVVQSKTKKGKKTAKVFFSTDRNMPGEEVLETYRLRFQIEFLYRDAKQYMGLSECQARSEEKIRTHVNASLTAVSLAKVSEHLLVPGRKGLPFSMASVKARYFNENLMNRIITQFGLRTEIDVNSDEYREISEYGCIAA